MTPRHLLVLLLVASAGCADEGTAIRVIVDTSLRVPEQVSHIGIEVLAASESGDFCQPYRMTVTLPDSSLLPVVFDVRKGEVYTDWLIYRVLAELDEPGSRGPYTVFEWQSEPVDWPDEGSTDHHVEIAFDCYQGVCPEGFECNHCVEQEQCTPDGCERLPDRNVFDDESLWTGSPYCNREVLP